MTMQVNCISVYKLEMENAVKIKGNMQFISTDIRYHDFTAILVPVAVLND